MALYNANLMIRESRKAQGLTQEQLAEGICSRETIVKIEKGERKPNWFVFREILIRLGLDYEIYHNDVTSEGDIELVKWYQECIALLNTGKYEELKAEIDKKEAEKSNSSMWSSGLGYELLLHLKAMLYSTSDTFVFENEKNHLNSSLAIENALECLQINRPGFEVEKIPEYYLAAHEFRLITMLANAYVKSNDVDKGIKIFEMMKANMEKNYSLSIGIVNNAHVINALYRRVFADIAASLSVAKRYEECIIASDEGMKLSLKFNEIFAYQTFLSLKAGALREIGRIDESRELSKQALMFHYLLDGHGSIDFELSKKWYQDYTGETLDLTAPW